MKLSFANIKLLKICWAIFVFSLVGSSARSQDTLRISLDTLIKGKTSAKDTLPKPSQSSDLKTTVKFTAKDSVKLNVKKKKAAMYEKAQIDYGQTQLKSAKIFLDLNSQIVQARPKFDSLNKMLDKPFLKEKNDEFIMDSVDYNLETQKGLIFNIVTKQGEGFVAGTRVKKDANNELCVGDGHYTTCDLAHPHFRIVAKKIKVTKGQNIVAGPFYLEVGDVPTPLGFAFGIFPKPKEKTSGIIIPEYGEARENGFFLRGGGYYWAISDYVDARFTGEIYTYGNWGIGASINYLKRYAFRGGFNFSYRSLFDNPLDEFNRNKTGQFSLSWNHSPESKGTGRFSASANIASSNFNRTSVTDINSLIQRNLNSAITYSKTFKGLPFALSLAGRHQQELARNEVTINLPDVNFTMNQIFPFKPLVKNSRSFLSTIGINYSLNGSNTISNRVPGTNRFSFATTERRPDSTYQFKPEFFEVFLQNARINLSHTSTLSAPFKLLKYFNGSLGANFTQNFHQRRFQYAWEENFDTTSQSYRGAVRVDTINRWGSTYRYSFSAGFSTNVYGFYNFPKAKGRLQAIRHTLIPNIAFSYSPDFSQARYGFYQRNVQTGVKNVPIGEGQFITLPRFEDVPIFESSPARGRTGSINISLRNVVEAKLRPKSDSANAKPEKINLLDELSFNTSYNMLAERSKGQHAWANVNMSTRMRLFKKIDINLNGVLDPYLYKDSLVGNQIQKVKTLDLAWSKGSLGQLSNANLSFSTVISPDFFKKGTSTTAGTASKAGRGMVGEGLPNTLLNPMANTPGLQTNTVQNPFNDVNRYVDFDVTWSLNVSYNLNFARLPVNNVTQTLTFAGDIGLTKNWKLRFNSNYDFKNKGFGPSQFSFVRNLHCWQMSFDWQPFGQFQSYFFRLNANASTLRDLKVERRRTQYDR